MGSQNSASGSGGNQSSVPAKNRFGSSDDVNRSIAERANKAAMDALDIQKTYSGPNKMTVTGYRSGTGNQMYGSEFSQARNRYLESIGAGTMSASGSFVPGVQTDSGLLFTSQNRDIYNRTKSKDIPLSKQMFESQKKFQLGLSAIAALAGVPMIPSTLATQSMLPYQSYVDRRESGFFSYRDNTQQNNNKTNQTDNNKKQDNEMFENRFLAEQEKQRKNYLASLKTSQIASGDRKFIKSSTRGFGGSFVV
jgi:hypothetical protein